MAAVTIHSDFGAQENKICQCFLFFPIYLPWCNGTRCWDLHCLNVEFLFFFYWKVKNSLIFYSWYHYHNLQGNIPDVLKRKKDKATTDKRPQECTSNWHHIALIDSYTFCNLWLWQSWTRRVSCLSCNNFSDYGSSFLLWQIFTVPLTHLWQLSQSNLQLSWQLLALSPAKNCSPFLLSF